MAAERIVFGKDFFVVNPAKTALLVIDMQNGFVAEGAAYETPDARAMLPKMDRILGFARQHKMPVVWTRSDHSAPFGGVMLSKFPTIREDRTLWKGEPSFDYFRDMTQPRDGEYQVVKHKYDAFFETDLDAILRNSKVDTVIIIGTATNVCCESTARSAFYRDYKVIMPSDCNASFDRGMHDAALKTIDMFFGRVTTTEELLAEMNEQLK